jgi:hypothetical protein
MRARAIGLEPKFIDLDEPAGARYAGAGAPAPQASRRSILSFMRPVMWLAVRQGGLFFPDCKQNTVFEGSQ